MTFGEAWKEAVPAEAQLQEGEARLLFDTIKKIPDENALIVEVGTLHGHSAKLMSLTGKKIKTIDIILRSIDIKGVEFIKGDSVDVAETFNDDSIDLIFIDADHDYEAVKKDIEAWTPKVKKRLFFHDYDSWEGVTRAVDESGLKKIKQIGSLILCQK